MTQNSEVLETKADQAIQPIMAAANQVIVTTPSESLQAQELIRRINLAKKGVREMFGDLKAATHTAWKKVCDKEGSKLTILDHAHRTVEQKVLAYNREQQRKHDEKERIARAKAEERERKEREEAEKKAKKLAKNGQHERAEAVRDSAYVAPKIPTLSPPPQPIKSKGSSFRETWVGEVVDIRALCRALAKNKTLPMDIISVNQGQLNALARLYKNKTEIPGVRFYSKQSLSVRG